MGEAKRRKNLDPSFGVHSINIEKSLITENWLIILDGHTFDSAINYEDAEKVANWLKTQLEKDPLPRNFSNERFTKWVSRNAFECPDVPARMFKYNQTIGQTKSFISNIEDVINMS